MRLLTLLCAVLGAAASAQVAAVDTTDLPPHTEPYEVAVFRSIYGVEAPAFALAVGVVNETAYPIYLGAAPALWAGAALTDADLDPALRLTAAQGVNFGLTLALKNLIRRPRPYAALDGVVARDHRYQRDRVLDPYSFPSGHTSSAFVIATSLSLSYPEWYVIVPAAAWATTMGVARVWHGVHYPSDVLVGAAIGLASGTLVHFVAPDVFGGDEADPGARVPVRIVLPL